MAFEVLHLGLHRCPSAESYKAEDVTEVIHAKTLETANWVIQKYLQSYLGGNPTPPPRT